MPCSRLRQLLHILRMFVVVSCSHVLRACEYGQAMAATVGLAVHTDVGMCIESLLV
jgi:hypothetical protein